MKEKLYNYLKTKKDFVSYEKIEEALHISTNEEKEELKKAAEELEKELKLYISKNHQYVLFEVTKNKRGGTISINKKGEGFLKVANIPNEDDIKIPKTELKYALDNDKVAVEIVEFGGKDEKRYTPMEPGKRYGRVIKIIDRDLYNIVGEIVKGEEGLEFKPFDKKDAVFLMDEDELGECVEGEIVVLEKVKDLGRNTFATVLKKKLGHKDDAHMDILAICAKHEIYDDFPEEVLKELEDIPDEVQDKDRVGRVDLTDKVIFTIDGKDTKDIDDAISIEMSEDGKYFILGVHIADVSYYVKPGSALDQEAYKRGTSCYPPGCVIPMLPHKLSNGICSLNEKVDRCAFSCEVKIDRYGQIKGFEFFKSIINSKKKMNYDDVNSIIERGEIPTGYEDFSDTLKIMQELAHVIRHAREDRGAADFDILEPKVICDLDGTPTSVEARERGEGERLIEDFMLSANEAAAKTEAFNKVLGRPSLGVYRVHEYPLPTKVQGFISLLSSLGHPVKGDIKNITYRTIGDILKQVTFKNKIEEDIIKNNAVRCQKRAYYSDDNLGHFGLALKYYAHFTSPIRRYPDLECHRIIADLALNPNVDDETYDRYAKNLSEICNQCSDREQKADEAERECESMKMAEYMAEYIKEHPDEEYKSYVTGVASFGIFVKLPNLVSGMIPIGSLDGFYTYDESTQSLSSKGRAPIRLGDELQVKCIAASKEDAQVTFEIVKKLEDKKNNNNDNNNYNKRKKLTKDHGRSI
ncbi:MAG: ribonuclease R [Bacilli bacterium]|nr:ribonuclease R [Bacilli bacterium]